MPKRRILWFPKKGINNTMPKHGETTSAIMKVEAVNYAVDASEMSVYNDQEISTRRDLKASNSTDYGTIYAIERYTRGTAVAASSGIYLDSALKKSVSLSSYASMVPWYQSLYYSTGSAMGYIDSGDTDYALGIDPPTTTEANIGMTTSGIYSCDWTRDDESSGTVTNAAVYTFTAADVGKYIQVGHKLDDCGVGTITAYNSGTSVDVSMLFADTSPSDFVGQEMYVGDVLLQTHSSWLSQGEYIVRFKYRAKRNGDGARSNTVTLTTTNAIYPEGYVDTKKSAGLVIKYFFINGLPTTHPDSDVTHWEILRQDESVTTSQLYRVTQTVALADAATIDDDSNMTSSLTALDDDNKYPCPYTLDNLCFHGSRLYGTYANRVYYSEAYITEPRFGYFGPIGENYFEFPDTVKTIVPDGRMMYVFMERGTWLLEGLDPNSATKRLLNEDIGTYSQTSVDKFGDGLFTISADYKFYMVKGAAWQEVPKISGILSTSPSYYELEGSDNAVWISDGSVLHRYDLSNDDLWTYSVGGHIGRGSHTTYVGRSGRLYEVDALGGSESTPSSYVVSPDIYIGNTDGHRGMFHRLLFRCQCDSGIVHVYIDGRLWKTMTFTAPTEQNVLLHFYPAYGYYAKVKIVGNRFNELRLTGTIILNPW